MRRFTLSLACAWILSGCEETQRPSSINSDAGIGQDVAFDLGNFPRDVYVRPDVPGVDPCRPGPCGDFELCGPATADGGMGPGNGVDDDCDGRVDEGCPCAVGEMRSCFTGPGDRRAVGACRDGSMRCTELGAWVGNECAGATGPAKETCNGADDDCDGSIDDGVTDCATALRCPPSAGVEPLQTYTLDGRTIDPMARAFAWTVTCPEGVTPCPAPANANDATLRVMLVRAGRYTVTLTLDRGGGRMDTCRFPLYVQGRGLRVELDWDRKGGMNSPGVDLDLHVAPMDRRRATSFHWFTRSEDCYFLTCKAPGGTVVWSSGASDTRYAPTMGSTLCENAPPPFGELWRASGRCWNPRLDTDNITCDPMVRDTGDPTFCFPENAALDNPPDDVTYRLMVNFYRDHGTCVGADTRDDIVHPVLAVHCGGVMRAAVGSVDDGLVAMRCQDNPNIGSSNWSWLAADVRMVTNACGVRDCRVTPLRAVPLSLPRCATVREDQDVCMDERARVFVRRTGGRAVETELPESP